VVFFYVQKNHGIRDLFLCLLRRYLSLIIELRPPRPLPFLGTGKVREEVSVLREGCYKRVEKGDSFHLDLRASHGYSHPLSVEQDYSKCPSREVIVPHVCEPLVPDGIVESFTGTPPSLRARRACSAFSVHPNLSKAQEVSDPLKFDYIFFLVLTPHEFAPMNGAF